MIIDCNCPKEKNCAGHITIQNAKLLFSNYKYMNRDVLDDIVTVPTNRCFMCGEEGTVDVIRKDWHEYMWDNPRKTVQEYFPYLDASMREQIISGSHPKCFDTLREEE